MGKKKQTSAPAETFNLLAKALDCGFFRANPESVIKKLREELTELSDEVDKKDKAGMKDEYGDLLFVAAQFALASGVNADKALRQANRKFSRRFSYIEKELAVRGLVASPKNRELMWKLWDEAKKQEKPKKAKKPAKQPL